MPLSRTTICLLLKVMRGFAKVVGIVERRATREVILNYFNSKKLVLDQLEIRESTPCKYKQVA